MQYAVISCFLITQPLITDYCIHSVIRISVFFRHSCFVIRHYHSLGVTTMLSIYTRIWGAIPKRPGEPLSCAWRCGTSSSHFSGSASSFFQALARMTPEPSGATSTRDFRRYQMLGDHLKLGGSSPAG